MNLEEGAEHTPTNKPNESFNDGTGHEEAPRDDQKSDLDSPEQLGELHTFKKHDLKAEIEAWSQMITLLIAKGATRGRKDPIPDALLSLE